jgi:hypothetical protein
MESNLRSINGTSRRRSFNLKGTGLINGWGFNLPTAKIVNAFQAAGDVNRKAAVMTETELVAKGGSRTGSPWDYQGAIRTKYATHTSDTNEAGIQVELHNKLEVVKIFRSFIISC